MRSRMSYFKRWQCFSISISSLDKKDGSQNNLPKINDESVKCFGTAHIVSCPTNDSCRLHLVILILPVSEIDLDIWEIQLKANSHLLLRTMFSWYWQSLRLFQSRSLNWKCMKIFVLFPFKNMVGGKISLYEICSKVVSISLRLQLGILPRRRVRTFLKVALRTSDSFWHL